MSNLFTTSKGVITTRSAIPDDAALLRELRLESLLVIQKYLQQTMLPRQQNPSRCGLSA